MSRIGCGHCWGKHETIAQVRECSSKPQVEQRNLQNAKRELEMRVRRVPMQFTRTDLPTNVQINAQGIVTWTNPKRNPWKEQHHQMEQDYAGGEYTRKKAAQAVENEFRGTDQYGFLCPNVNCNEGYCHYRATVNASFCPSCRTAMHAGSHEVYSPGTNFEPAQWYLIRLARWVLKHAAKVESDFAQWTQAQMVDWLNARHLLKFDKAIAALGLPKQ